MTDSEPSAAPNIAQNMAPDRRQIVSAIADAGGEIRVVATLDSKHVVSGDSSWDGPAEISSAVIASLITLTVQTEVAGGKTIKLNELGLQVAEHLANEATDASA